MNDCRICLQDPRHTDRNLEYHNPHRLRRSDGIILYTHDLEDTKVEIEAVSGMSNMFDLFATNDFNGTLPEANPPSALRTLLYR
jgi:hypothetical protein